MWAVSLFWEAQQLIGTARFMTGKPVLTKGMLWAVTLWSSTSHMGQEIHHSQCITTLQM